MSNSRGSFCVLDFVPTSIEVRRNCGDAECGKFGNFSKRYKNFTVKYFQENTLGHIGHYNSFFCLKKGGELRKSCFANSSLLTPTKTPYKYKNKIGR